MTKPETALSADVGIKYIGLRSLEFVRYAGKSRSYDELPLTLRMVLGRTNEESLTVEIRIEVDVPERCKIAVSYGALFVKRVDPIEDEDAYWKRIASQVAPVVLFPFIRETIASTVIKSGLPPLVLPLVDMRRAFPIDEISIPEIESSTKPDA